MAAGCVINTGSRRREDGAFYIQGCKQRENECALYF